MDNELNILKLQYQVCGLRKSISELSATLLSICKMLDEDELNSSFMKIKEEINYEDTINKIEEEKKELAEQIKELEEYSKMDLGDIFKKILEEDFKQHDNN